MKLSFKYNESKSKGEIASIVLMRGIASLMVCYFHLTNGDKDYLPDSSLVKKSGEWGWAGVQIFFIVSGFVIPYSMYIKGYTIKNFWSFLKKRIIRIEPPYIVSIAMVLIMAYISSCTPFYRGLPFNLDWWNIAGHIAYFNAFTGAKWLQDVYWTLAIEFQYYILIALCYTLLVSKKNYLRLLFFAGFMLSVFLRPYMPLCIFSFAPYFLSGILLFQYYCSVIPEREFWILLLTTMSMLLFLDGPILTLIVAIAIILIAIVKKIHPVFVFLGTISYSLYLVHIPMGGRFVSIANRVLPDNVQVKEVLVYAAVGFSLLMAWLYYILIEKRFKIIASRISYTNTPVTAVPAAVV